MTKKQYTTKKTELEKTLAGVVATLELAAETEGKSLNNIDNWNKLHDFQYDLEDALKSLEGDWSRRNWTVSDYTAKELINANVD